MQLALHKQEVLLLVVVVVCMCVCVLVCECNKGYGIEENEEARKRRGEETPRSSQASFFIPRHYLLKTPSHSYTHTTQHTGGHLLLYSEPKR